MYYHYNKQSLGISGIQNIVQQMNPEQMAVLVARYDQKVDFNTVVDKVHISFATNTLIKSKVKFKCKQDTSIMSSIHSVFNSNSELWDGGIEWFFISKEDTCINFQSLSRVLGSFLTKNKPTIVSGATSIEALTNSNHCEVPIGSGFAVNREWLHMYRAIVCNDGDCSEFDANKIHLMFRKEMFWVHQGVILEHIPTWYCGTLRAMEHPDVRNAVDHNNIVSFIHKDALDEDKCVDCVSALSKSGYFEYYAGTFYENAKTSLGQFYFMRASCLRTGSERDNVI
ncbi:hypothetical protein AKO1_006682 [Acrasis kona]|uniref:Uncharacterized protein n=1 Tax=Acrasis kona TaxID=1008807 RepID=A0AAW2ZLJ9_9EUKA